MKICDYETQKVIEFTGKNDKLVSLRKCITQLLYDDSYKIFTDLFAASEVSHQVSLEQYEKQLFDEFEIKKEIGASKIRVNEIDLPSKKKCVLMKIDTEDQINKYVSKLCQKFKVNAIVIVKGFNEDEDELFEHVYDVTNCYSDGTCESNLIQWEEYEYRYNSGYFWNDMIEVDIAGVTDNEMTYEEFISYYSFLNHNDIQFIEGKYGPLKK